MEYDVEDMISPLVERSLLRRGHNEKGAEVYYVHRITAQFLKALTPDSEQNESHQRAAEYYEYEIRNNHGNSWGFLIARQHYLACGDLEQAAKIAFAFETVLRTRGNYELATQLSQATLKHAQDEQIKAAAFQRIGVIHYLQGRYKDALKYYNDSLRIQQELGNQVGIAASLYYIGWIHQDQGRYKDALKYYNDSLRIQQESGNQDGIANSLHQIGTVHSSQGRYEDALKHYNDSLRIRRELGNQAGIADSLHNIGIIHHSQGRYEDALKYYNDSLRIQQELGNQAGIAHSLHNIGMIHQHQGRYEDALKYYNDSLRIRQELGNQASIASSFGQIGVLCSEQNDDRPAMRYLLRAFVIFRYLQSPSAQIAASYLSQIRERIEEAEFEKIWQAEMREIEQKGPFVVED